MDNKFSSNLIAFLIGIVVFGTDLFSRMPSIDRVGITFLGGYLVLSLYHAWKFASPRFSDFTSVVVFWLFPVVLAFSVVFSLLVGLVVSVPKFIISFFKWSSEKQTTRAVHRQSMNHKHLSKPSKRSVRGVSNVIPFNFKSR
jgi:MFS superfamily sulfate permease-like transporter